jgi:hypothetical protein
VVHVWCQLEAEISCGSSLLSLQQANHLSLAVLVKPPTLLICTNHSKHHDCDHGRGVSSLALASSEESLSSLSESKIGGLDDTAIGKYMLTLAIQMGLITGIFTGLDKVVAKYSLKIALMLSYNLKMLLTCY